MNKQLSLIGLALVLIGGIAFLFAERRSIRNRADMLLSDVEVIATTTDPTSRFVELRRRYGNRIRFVACANEECSFEEYVSNGRLYAVRLLPYSQMTATFSVFQGQLSTVHIEYRAVSRAGRDCVVHVQLDSQREGERERYFYLDPHGIRTQLSNGNVEFSSAATKEEVDAALSLNSACLIRMLACERIDQINARLWKRMPDGRVASRMRSMADAYSDVIVP